MTDSLDSTIIDSANAEIVKLCKTCKIFKLLADFCKNKGTKDRLNYECRSCSKIRQKPILERDMADRHKKKAIRLALEAEIKRNKPKPEGYISRENAKAIGQTWFFDGEPCHKRGHIGKKQTSNRLCHDCRIADQEDDRRKAGVRPMSDRRTNILQPDGTYLGLPCVVCGNTKRNKLMKCPTCCARRTRENKARNPEREIARYHNNKEKHRERYLRTYQRDKDRYAEAAIKRRIQKMNAKPLWLSLEERKAIRKFYRDTPKGMVVDHIVPLQGKMVCGLHCLCNLQYLSALENARKKNKFPYGKESERLAVRQC